jgi:hypothetical protein
MIEPDWVRITPAPCGVPARGVWTSLQNVLITNKAGSHEALTMLQNLALEIHRPCCTEIPVHPILSILLHASLRAPF